MDWWIDGLMDCWIDGLMHWWIDLLKVAAALCRNEALGFMISRAELAGDESWRFFSP